MLILIPIAHDDHAGRRWPLATTVLVALNVLAFLGSLYATSVQMPHVEEAARTVTTYQDAHPYLHLPPTIAGIPIRQQVAAPSRAVDPQQIPDEQRQLDALVATFEDELDALPSRRFGYVPKKNNVLGLFTSMFMHGGWLHLIFNMWFMWLCASNLEDRWGRRVFVPFFLGAGILAALAQKLAAPESAIPLIGASGAVAAAMGAFLVTHARTRISFLYLVFVRFGTFRAPAWVALALWALGEVLSALLSPADLPGTAHWAHVAGFGVGAAFAGILRVTGYDKKLDDAAEDAVTLSPLDPRLSRALDALDAGKGREAMGLLDQLLAEQPRNVDAWITMLRAAHAQADNVRVATAYAKLAAIHLAQGELTLAADVVSDAQSYSVASAIPRAVRLRLAAGLAEGGQKDSAIRTCMTVLGERLAHESDVQATVECARLMVQLGRGHAARSALEAARSSPLADGRMRAQIDELLSSHDPLALDV